MDIKVIREGMTKVSTYGKMYVDGQFFCYTIEDVEREKKIKGKTAIPLGRYKVEVTPSPRFHREMVLLHDVPKFEGIRIHSGNDATHTDGCIIVARNRLNKDYIQGDSRKLEGMITNLVKKEKGDVYLTVMHAPNFEMELEEFVI